MARDKLQPAARQSKDSEIADPVQICPRCSQLNRIAPHKPTKKPVCGVCRADLPDPFYALGGDVFVGVLACPTERLSFRLLPPGTWDIDTVRSYYRLGQHVGIPDGYNKRIQLDRIDQLKLLDPIRCYVGIESWLGYVVLEFSFTKKVVLECPFEGNAIYILPANWKRLVHQDKQAIRKNCRGLRKVVHKGEWLERVRAALR